MADRRVGAILELEDQMSAALKSAEGRLKSLGRTGQQIGGDLTRYLTVPILAIGGLAVKSAIDFEASMSNVRSVTNASAEDMKLLQDTAVEMARRYKGSAKDAGDALYYIASAGYTAKDSAAALQGVMALASATNSDLAETSENVMAAISMFGLKATETTRVADVYAKACQISQAEMRKLADSMRYAGPIAKTLGWTLEQTTATLSRLYDAGFKGEQAGTILRASLSRLIDPSKEVKDTLDVMGISVEQLATAMKNPADLIDLFRSRSITAQQAVALFGQEAGPGMLTLLEKGGSAIRDYEEKLESAAGTAETAADVQMANLQGRLEQMRDSLDKVGISLSKQSGAFDTFATALENIALWLDSLSISQQKWLVGIALAVAALGPLITILSKVVLIATSLFGAFATGIGALVTACVALDVVILKLVSSSDSWLVRLRAYIDPLYWMYVFAGKVYGELVKLGILDSVAASTNAAATATDTLRIAQQNLIPPASNAELALQRVKIATDQKKAADDEANLAQLAYNEACIMYGPASAQAKAAHDTLVLAQQVAKEKADALAEAQRIQTDVAGESAAAANNLADRINAVAGSINKIPAYKQALIDVQVTMTPSGRLASLITSGRINVKLLGVERQHGGLVPGSLGEAVPIIAHAGERVVPRTGASMHEGGAGLTIVFNGDMTLDTESRLDQLVDKIERALGRRGMLTERGLA